MMSWQEVSQRRHEIGGAVMERFVPCILTLSTVCMAQEVLHGGYPGRRRASTSSRWSVGQRKNNNVGTFFSQYVLPCDFYWFIVIGLLGVIDVVLVCGLHFLPNLPTLIGTISLFPLFCASCSYIFWFWPRIYMYKYCCCLSFGPLLSCS